MKPVSDWSAPRLTRNVWPKKLPPLTEEQNRINDDFVRLWHEILPRRYGLVERFNHTYPLQAAPPRKNSRTLEIGAGLGEHIEYEDLDRQEYHAVELRSIMAEAIERRFPKVHTVVADCQRRLPFPDAHFDRVVAIHVLEHLPDLPKALDEVRRVLRPEGSFAIVYPCDPGILYEFARKISAERVFRRTYGLPYGWLIRREHINSPSEIEAELAKRFRLGRRRYFPLGVPVVSLNLCVGVLAR
jgi:SAM-dependent methyltransferase